MLVFEVHKSLLDVKDARSLFVLISYFPYSSMFLLLQCDFHPPFYSIEQYTFPSHCTCLNVIILLSKTFSGLGEKRQINERNCW